ncbi:MAG: hypothetical protein WBO23_08480 [Burkholderiales bacterium]
MTTEIAALNLLAGWLGMLGGVVSGAAIGLFFHDDAWMGGYGSFRRRLTRLGHISFFGLGFVNLMFAFSLRAVEISVFEARLASWCFIVGLVAMPICCFLTAWRKPLRHLFPIPVLSVGIGIVALLAGWPWR